MNQKVLRYQRKTVIFRSTKTLDVEKFNEDLIRTAPWNVMETFDTLDDMYHYWQTLFNSIVNKHLYSFEKNEIQKTGCSLYDSILETSHQDEEKICSTVCTE